MLGGPDRRTLFMLAAGWRGTEGVEEVLEARIGQVLVVDAAALASAGRKRLRGRRSHVGNRSLHVDVTRRVHRRAERRPRQRPR
jgi:hypothetical protein